MGGGARTALPFWVLVGSEWSALGSQERCALWLPLQWQPVLSVPLLALWPVVRADQRNRLEAVPFNNSTAEAVGSWRMQHQSPALQAEPREVKTWAKRKEATASWWQQGKLGWRSPCNPFWG